MGGRYGWGAGSPWILFYLMGAGNSTKKVHHNGIGSIVVHLHGVGGSPKLVNQEGGAGLPPPGVTRDSP